MLFAVRAAALPVLLAGVGPAQAPTLPSHLSAGTEDGGVVQAIRQGPGPWQLQWWPRGRAQPFELAIPWAEVVGLEALDEAHVLVAARIVAAGEATATPPASQLLVVELQPRAQALAVVASVELPAMQLAAMRLVVAPAGGEEHLVVVEAAGTSVLAAPWRGMRQLPRRDAFVRWFGLADVVVVEPLQALTLDHGDYEALGLHAPQVFSLHVFDRQRLRGASFRRENGLWRGVPLSPRLVEREQRRGWSAPAMLGTDGPWLVMPTGGVRAEEPYSLVDAETGIELTRGVWRGPGHATLAVPDVCRAAPGRPVELRGDGRVETLTPIVVHGAWRHARSVRILPPRTLSPRSLQVGATVDVGKLLLEEQPGAIAGRLRGHLLAAVQVAGERRALPVGDCSLLEGDVLQHWGAVPKLGEATWRIDAKMQLPDDERLAHLVVLFQFVIEIGDQDFVATPIFGSAIQPKVAMPIVSSDATDARQLQVVLEKRSASADAAAWRSWLAVRAPNGSAERQQLVERIRAMVERGKR